MSAGEGRTVAELLDDSDGSAREALLDMSADRALGMVRGWPQLMQAAAELWAILPPGPTVSPNADPIAILAAMGRAVDRSVAAGHCPGAGRVMRHGSRSHPTSCRPGTCYKYNLWHPKLHRPAARPAQLLPTPRSCTRCMSPHTPPRWHSAGMSVAFKIVWKLVRGDSSPWLSDPLRWRSSRSGA